MTDSHDNTRSWQERLTDRLLNLIGTKFIGTLLILILAFIALCIGLINGAEWVAISLGALGVHGSTNAFITSRYSMGAPSAPITINHQPRHINMEQPDDVAPTDPESIEDDGVYP